MVRVNGDRVLVERIAAPKPTSSLIEVVSLGDTPSQYATVVAVGNGRRRPSDGSHVPIPLEIGQVVITMPYCGTPMDLDGRELFMLMEDDILGVVDADS